MYIYIRMYNVLFSEYDIYNNLKASSLARLSVLCMCRCLKEHNNNKK